MDRETAAQVVADEVEDANSITDIRAWWTRTRVPNLFLTILQRFINSRTAFQNELGVGRLTRLSGFAFSEIPFISTTKSPERASRYALGTVVATKTRRWRHVRGKVAGKVFVYLFNGNDLVQLRAADIQYIASQGGIAPHARYAKADREVTFIGSIPQENRVGEVIARSGESSGAVAQRARGVASAKARPLGGLIPWS